MNKINLEYVASALGGMGIFAKIIEDHHHDEMTSTLHEAMNVLKKQVSTSCIYTTPRISTLFNAYTEQGIVPKLKAFDNIGAHSIYADSGGLQIVTAGKIITPQIKDKIYEIQQNANYAMCFDEIPLEKTTSIQTSNERSNISNKIFNQARHTDSGILTGQNIKKQVESFRAANAKTKAIIIVQGNNAEDMLHYFEQIESQLSLEDYDYIGGMAVADTCIGNGELESIEMLKGARAISKICHPVIKKHLHILGVGSIHRMRPILYLIKSGYLDNFEHVSYDSSSHTCTFRFGLIKLNGTCRPLGAYRNPVAEEHFAKVYEYFEECLKPKLTLDKFLDIILLDGKKSWSMANVKANARTKASTELVIGYMANPLHTYYQMGNFITCLDGLLDSEVEDFDSIGHLLKVRTDEDMNEWFRTLSSYVNSKRIMRKEDHGSLEALFGD